MQNRQALQALIIEDSEFDARVLVNHLRQGGYDVAFTRVETPDAVGEALQRDGWQVVLADYNLPGFSALEALKLVQESGRDLPFIIVSGGIGEDIAVAAMKAGAHDYLMKGSLARLVPAVEREIRDAEVRRSRRQAQGALRESEERLRLLWETSPDAVLFCDEQAAITFANPAVETVFGYPPAELAGRPLGDLEAPATRGTLQSHLRPELLNTAGPQRPTETAGLRRDGREILIEATFSAMELHGRRFYVVFIRDITEKRRAEEELRKNEEQFRVAREIQQRLFPKGPPALEGFDVAGATFPAEATGGDYLDYLPMAGGHVGLVVADVSGHGLGPALLMAETRAYLRILARNRSDPGEILTRANRVLADDVDGERYVTTIYVRLHPPTGDLVYASAGHQQALLVGADGTVKQRLRRTGIVLGVQRDAQVRSAPAGRMAPGDLLLLLTDGIEEAPAPSGEVFGIERVLATVKPVLSGTAAQILEALHRAVLEFSRGGPGLDDVTLVVVKAGEESAKPKAQRSN